MYCNICVGRLKIVFVMSNGSMWYTDIYRMMKLAQKRMMLVNMIGSLLYIKFFKLYFEMSNPNPAAG